MTVGYLVTCVVDQEKKRIESMLRIIGICISKKKHVHHIAFVKRDFSGMLKNSLFVPVWFPANKLMWTFLMAALNLPNLLNSLELPGESKLIKKFGQYLDVIKFLLRK